MAYCHSRNLPRTHRRAPRAAGAAATRRAPVPPPAATRRDVLSPPQRTKLDADDDRSFYSLPRLVHHVDPTFRARVTALYRRLIPAGGEVLDLCSSWVSHLPEDVEYARVVGHGMNAIELSRNPRLSEFYVRNLNSKPGDWAAADGTYDAVLCCVSVQYLQRPEEVWAEAARVLKPGGVFIVTWSNRMFYDKAIKAWRDNTAFGRTQLVRSYFQATPGFAAPVALAEADVPAPAAGQRSGLEGAWDALQQLWRPPGADPFYAMYARKRGGEGGLAN